MPVVSPGCQGSEFLINQMSVILHVINVIQDVITAICIVAISMSKEGMMYLTKEPCHVNKDILMTTRIRNGL